MRASSHPDFNRRSRNSTGSAPRNHREEFADYHRRLGFSPTPEHVLRYQTTTRARRGYSRVVRTRLVGFGRAAFRPDVCLRRPNRSKPLLPGPARQELRTADGRAESGLETIARLIALDLGFRVRPQVRFHRIGRVDLLVEDWIVVETDGSAFHDLPLAAGDRRRDALLAATGRTVLRPGYALIVHDRATLARQLIGAVESHRRVHDSGQLAARARRRLERMGLA